MAKQKEGAKKVEYSTAVIGGGLAGCLATIELANKERLVNGRKKICLIEANEGLLQGTSNVTPGRMGLGFHYIHKDTAIVYLHSTIEFVKKYKAPVKLFAKEYRNSVEPLVIGGDKEESNPLRRGRYFITEDSLFPKEDILLTYEALQAEYRRLCEEDSSNQVFGDPDVFFQILEPSEYEGDVGENIICGIETSEHLLNWPLFKDFVIEEITRNRNIDVFTGIEVKKVGFDAETNEHVLFCYDRKNNQLKYKIHSPFVINCTWEHVEEITDAAGFLPVHRTQDSESSKPAHTTLENRERTNRLKILVEVKLPESLKNAHSMFFCMGAHCMFSNIGNGYGMLTYAPVTNSLQSTAVSIPKKMAYYLSLNNGDDSDESVRTEVTEYGNKIIKGVSQYIPEMAMAELLSVRFGIVITKGNVDIFDHNSDFHIRNYNGITSEEYPLGWINNTCMKLLYAYDNAVSIGKIVDEQKAQKQLISEKVEELEERLPADKKRALASVLYRYFSSAELLKEENKHQTMSFEKSKHLIQAAMKGRLLINSEICPPNVVESGLVGKEEVFNQSIQI